MSVISVSVTAQPVRSGSVDPTLLVVNDELFIHDMTPDLARQWIGVLTKIAEES